jgi:glycosyltransferase involved in cell wall biosynthesis
MRILWANHRDPSHPEAGGAEVHLREVCKRLVQRGNQVTLLCERFSGSTPLDSLDGVTIRRSGGPFEVHLLTPAKISQLAGNNDIVVDDIAHAVPWWSQLVTRKPVIGIIHHVHQNVTRRELSPSTALVARIAERTIRFTYKRIITVSEASKREVETELGVEPSRISVVHHGVDHSRYIPARRKFAEPTILWLGRIKRYKNLEDLLQAFATAKKAVPQLRLIIAGDGDHRQQLEGAVRRQNLEHVIFTGRVDSEEKVELLQKSWALCLTSDVEGWGLVLTEAAACGLPAIAYDSGATREAVIHNQTGFLVEPGDVQALAQRIVRLVSDPELLASLSAGALEYSQNFDWEKTTDETLKIFSQATNN